MIIQSTINKFKITQIIMIIIGLVYVALFLLGLFGNPLSEKEILSVTTKPLYKTVLEDENFWDEEGESLREYFTADSQKVFLLKTENSSCSQLEIKFKSGQIKCVPLEEIRNPYVHPLEISSHTDDNYHILGTIAKPKTNGLYGIDRLSNLSESIFRTTFFSLLSLVTFLFFGIYFALSIGYYGNASRLSKFLNIFNQLIVKSFQSVPILLWILIMMIILGSNRDLDQISKIYIYFLFFGLCSSPALSIFQIAYVMAHAFFLDLTLCFIEKSSEDSGSLGFYMYQAYTTPSFATDANYLLCIAFLLTFILFYWANYYKQKV